MQGKKKGQKSGTVKKKNSKSRTPSSLQRRSSKAKFFGQGSNVTLQTNSSPPWTKHKEVRSLAFN